jgi:hypothetical protein
MEPGLRKCKKYFSVSAKKIRIRGAALSRPAINRLKIYLVPRGFGSDAHQVVHSLCTARTRRKNCTV